MHERLTLDGVSIELWKCTTGDIYINMGSFDMELWPTKEEAIALAKSILTHYGESVSPAGKEQ